MTTTKGSFGQVIVLTPSSEKALLFSKRTLAQTSGAFSSKYSDLTENA